MRPSPYPRKSAAQQGVAAIEMAILLPLLVLIFTGMIEYGRLMWHYDALAKATRDAARFLADLPLTGGTGETLAENLDDAQTMVENAADAAGIKDLLASHVTASCDPNCTAPTRVTVRVDYPFAIGGWAPVFGTGLWTVTMSPHTTMRYMR
jgi:Flp pilus assembly protein TadG